jgi:hypothetical protein
MMLGIGFLGILMMFKPATCRAQADVNPDHYDTINSESISTVHSSTKTKRNASSSRDDLTAALRQQPSASAVISSNSVDAERPQKSGDSKKVFQESSSHPRKPRTLLTRNNRADRRAKSSVLGLWP